ncbi:amidohydrolase family protein [Anaerophaga thermohalophila]|jgi:L-fuconolactonase|uniref:amidohydrolase family protein n=1 Tax=Anaerophaga thermohalophila TaxID=177400 RepID=UPI0003117389|nr:amidohydrolase family protein [Anaerophaga thermohalophila]
MIIDSHQHFWNYNREEFDWINNDMTSIKKSFLPKDLKATLSGIGVEGVVSVQARQSLEETDWLLQLAAENEFIKGVVGWVPLSDKNIPEILSRFKNNNSLKGVRHVIQGEPDPQFILKKNFNNGISQLKKYGLIYDILIFGRQLPNTIRFVDQHPDQPFVLDHIAKPEIRLNEIKVWKKDIKELARRENVSCKLSGMVTEADFTIWTEDQLKPYFDVVLEAFGPGRLLFGSDWPVCLVATSYKSWLKLVKKWISKLSSLEQEQILGRNARLIYNL